MHLWAVGITGNIHTGRDGNKSISSYAFLLILLYLLVGSTPTTASIIIKNKGTMKELLTLWKTDCQAEGFTAREYVYGFIGTLVLVIAVLVEGIINTL